MKNERIVFKCPGGVYNATPPRILFGRGTVNEIGDEVAFLGCERALVLSTPGRAEMADGVARTIGRRCAGVLPEAVSQVPIELARKARDYATSRGIDCLVAVGGGAAVGLAKGIAYEYKAPIINVSTTYSGSEVTGFCGMTIDGVKRMHISLNMLAHTVIYDPDLTLGLPVPVSVASAMNALAHCVDAVYVPTVNPVTVLAAAEGAKWTATAAVEVAQNPADIDAREKLLYGGYLSGVALTGGFALQHGLAHVLGGTFKIEHGLSHALVLPYVAAYNARYVAEELVPVARALGTDPAGLGGAIYDLLGKLGLPNSLRGIDFKESDLPELVRIAVETDNGYNPAPVTTEAVAEIVENAWLGRRPSGRE